MILQGRLVRFRLSPEGKVALKGLFEKSAFSAFVVSADELGAWIDLGYKKPPAVGQVSVLMLLKWDYFSTAVLDYKPEPTAKRRPAGFRS
jgi:hypothetical protein